MLWKMDLIPTKEAISKFRFHVIMFVFGIIMIFASFISNAIVSAVWFLCFAVSQYAMALIILVYEEDVEYYGEGL